MYFFFLDALWRCFLAREPLTPNPPADGFIALLSRPNRNNIIIAVAYT